MKEIVGKDMFGVVYITQKQASYRYGFSQSWFKERRLNNLPPKCIKFGNKGKNYYPLEETDNWFKEYIASSE
jgi:hypothetical protein